MRLPRLVPSPLWWGRGSTVWVSPNMVSDPLHVHIRSTSPPDDARCPLLAALDLRDRAPAPAAAPHPRLRRTPSRVRKHLWMCGCWPLACPACPRSDRPVIPRGLARTPTSLQHGGRGGQTQRLCVESMMGRRRPLGWSVACARGGVSNAPGGRANGMEKEARRGGRSK